MKRCKELNITPGLLLCTMILGTGVAHAVDLVGSLPGDFAVSPLGTATYRIPIETPAATGGLQPSLQLIYDHRGGSGIAGQGWSLNGVSSITRCPQTLAQDSAIQPIEYDADDRFCLDGMRLIVISGTYGAANSEYRTEIESFRKIKASATLQGNGPQSFTVTDPDGTKHSYGHLQESSLTDSGSSSYRIWGRYRSEDLFGNQINYQFDANDTTGEFLLDYIEYTSNTARSLTANYKVDLIYGNRPTTDQRSGHRFGAIWSRTKRLNEIDVQISDPGWVNFNVYTMAYSTGASGRSQLDSVQRCRFSTCLPASTFDWQDAVPGWLAYSSSDRSSSGHTYPRVGDFDGDGQQDLFVVSGGEWHILLATTGGKFAAAIDTNKTATNAANAMVFDLDGDRKADLLFPGSDGLWKIYQSTGTTFAATIDTNQSTTGYTNSYAQDVDGDGRDDLLYRIGTDIYLRKSTGSNLATTASIVLSDEDMTNFIGTSTASSDPLVDFNGDGRGDILMYTYYFEAQPGEPPLIARSWGAYTFNGSTYTLVGGINTSDILTPILSDFSGDGLTDYLYVNTGASGTWRYRISEGDSMSSETNTGISGANSAKAVLADYDGDGRRDLIMATSTNWDVRKYTGTTFSGTANLIGGPDPLNSQAIPMDVSGDGNDELVMSYSSLWQIRNHKSSAVDVVTKFTDGLGNTVEPTYESIATSDHYTQTYAGSPPNTQSFQVPMFVVTDYKLNDGIGGTFVNTVKYWGSKRGMTGRGFLGFREVQETDDSGPGYRLSKRLYEQDFPYIGLLGSEELFVDSVSNERSKTDPTWINSTTYTGVYFVRPSLTDHFTYEIGGTYDGDVVSKVVDDPTHDATYGNVTARVITTTSDFAVGDTYTTTIDYTYSNLTTPWCLGLPTQLKVTRAAPLATTQVRTTNQTFDASTCVLLTTTDASMASTADQLKSTFTYDGYGNVKTVTRDNVSGSAADRKTEYFYDADGHLPTSQKDYIDTYADPATEFTWDYRLIKPLTVKDPRLLTTTLTYDVFGRAATVTRPDGTSVTVSYTVCASPCLFTKGSYYIDQAESVGFTRRDYRDSFDRAVGGWHHLPTGDKSMYQIDYDQQGRVSKRHIPWVDGESHTNFDVEMVYDLLGRVTSIDRPISEITTTGSTTGIAYEGLTYTVTDALSQVTKYEYDPIGRLVLATDDLSGETEYEYTTFDQLHKTWDPSNNLTTITYNARGEKVLMSVPGMLDSTCSSARTSAALSFKYNVFGELTSQLDAKCQETTYAYNQLGLVTSRVDDFGGAAAGTTTWSYFTSSDYKLWLPSSISSPGSITEAYTYESLSRVADVKTTIDSVTYEIDYEYHSTGSGKGQLKRVIYPVSTSGVRVKVDYDYDAYGLLQKVKDGDTPSKIYYQLHGTDALGRERHVELNDDGTSDEFDVDWDYDTASGFLQSIKTGPGLTATLQNLEYSWNKLGNLTSRMDHIQSNVTEVFTYDDLNRLDTVKLNSTQTLDVNYDAVGNITSKSDVGSYTYGSGHPHAVTSIAGTRAASYNYDHNGNMTDRDGDAITWHPYNMPKKIDFNSGAGTDFAEFTYGSDRSRLKQYNKTGSTYTTTYYIGGLYEKETVGAVTEHRHNIVANGKTVAVYMRPSSGSPTTQYVLRDHQRSVVAMIDDAGDMDQEFSFDAFGKRRNTNWTADTSDARFGDVHETERGYTGHEHLDNVRLIHMNGRVQDPIIGRMISADPFVPDPMNGQSFNRYSYVINNPLSRIDPTGFQDWPQYVLLSDDGGGRDYMNYWDMFWERKEAWDREFDRVDPRQRAYLDFRNSTPGGSGDPRDRPDYHSQTKQNAATQFLGAGASLIGSVFGIDLGLEFSFAGGVSYGPEGFDVGLIGIIGFPTDEDLPFELAVGYDGFYGVVNQSVSEMQGQGFAQNIIVGPATVSAVFDENMKEIGGQVGGGKGLPIGVSMTKTRTGTISYRGAVDTVANAICAISPGCL